MSNLFVAGLSVTHAETSQPEFGIYIVIPHPDHPDFPISHFHQMHDIF